MACPIRRGTMRYEISRHQFVFSGRFAIWRFLFAHRQGDFCIRKPAIKAMCSSYLPKFIKKDLCWPPICFSSACHGAGRQMSRHQALKNWSGRQIIDELKGRGIIVKSPSQRGVAEEAPGAYKDVGAVVEATEAAGLARKVARLAPMICIKG